MNTVTTAYCGAVGALDRAEQRGLDAAPRLGGAAALVDRPPGDARDAAGRLVGLVLLEQVQRPPLAVDQNHPDLGAGGRDRRRARRRRAGRAAAVRASPGTRSSGTRSPRTRCSRARSPRT